MRTSLIIAALTATLLAAVMIGCKSDSDVNGSSTPVKGQSTITGVVYDAGQHTLLAGVAVLAMEASRTQEDKPMTTNEQGTFSCTFDVDSLHPSTVMLTLHRTGYRDTVIIQPIASAKNYLLTIYFSPINSVITPGTSTSGLAQTIAFINVTKTVLSVYGVGGTQMAYMDWEVRDSLGLPIDAAHAVDLNFAIVNGPGDGAYVSPLTVRTTSEGTARTSINSGVRAGVMQILATAVVNGRTISSAPVRVEIVGGFPDQAHFSIAADSYNFAGQNWLNRRDKILVLVGDKYSNPAIGSVVYFRTTAGVVQGSLSGSGVLTDRDGLGSVDLISGNPTPDGAMSYVVARTVGENGVAVTDSVGILWSGYASITKPDSFEIANGGSQKFTFHVTDEFGNPLSVGTTISVIAHIPPPTMDGVEQNKVLLDFGNQGVLQVPDATVRGLGTTDFEFTVIDGSTGLIDPAGTPVIITISVTGPNVRGGGSISTTVSGVVH